MTAAAARPGARSEADIPRVWAATFDAPVVGVLSIAAGVAFLLGDGSIRFVSTAGALRAVQVHDGPILSHAFSLAENAVLTGGSDGKVMLTGLDGASRQIAHHESQWIDCVAAGGKSGALGWSAGKSAYHLRRDGGLREIELPSTPSGLAFDPKGRRLALSHYGGASLWLPKDDANLVRRLKWKGSHLGVAWSRDGGIVVTTMQEAALHGWRLSDGAEMQMAGYPAKIHSIAWNRPGTRLATGGAPAVIVWPFDAGGPWNRKPDEIGFMQSGVARVAWHPTLDVLAAGSNNGSVDVIRAADSAWTPLRGPADGAVSGLAWTSFGAILAIGTERGRAELHAFARP